MKDIMLSGYLKDFSRLHEFSDLDEATQFGHFVNYCVLSEYSYDDINLLEINVDGAYDLGIDGIVILVNGHCVTSTDNVRFFAEKLSSIEVEFVFIQSKTASRFKGHEIGTFLSGVNQFFSLTKDVPVNASVRRYVEIKDYIYDNYSIKLNELPLCRLVYASTGVWADDAALLSRIKCDTKGIEEKEILSSVDFIPYDSRKLKTIYKDLRKKIERVVLFDKRTTMPEFEGVTEAYTGIIDVREFFKLILNEDGKLIKSVFYDNVRDYQGENPVNKEISETLKDSHRRQRFPVLNNGVTVVARAIKKVGNNFSIHNYQIVNGCQTCNVLVNYKDLITDGFYVPIKIVVTDQQSVINEIIIATNRQTEVTTEAFESLSPFHQTLEDFYRHKGVGREAPLHYERRSKQYLYDGISPNNIVSLASQTANFVAMFLNQPQSTHRYYGELLESNRTKLYQDDHSPYPYYISSYASSLVHRYFLRNESVIPKEFRHHILMLLRMEIAGEAIPSLSGDGINAMCTKIEEIISDGKKVKKLIDRCCYNIQSLIAKFEGDHKDLHRSRAFTESILPNHIQRPEGEIVYYNNERAFGFIEVKSSKKDIFFHISDVEEKSVRNINKYASVIFDITETEKGYCAKNIYIKENVL